MSNYPVIVGGFKESSVSFKESNHPEGKGSKKLYIEGLAIPFGETSSNGVLYTKESLISTIPQWIGLPLMYNHLIEGERYPVGKVIDMREGVYEGVAGLLYKAEIDPQEVVLCNKVKGGYLNKVSIHILPENVIRKDGHQEAVVKRPLELSIVPVPGFSETNMAAYMEKVIGDSNMQNTKETKVETVTPQKVENVENKVETKKEEIVTETKKEEITTETKKDVVNDIFVTKEKFNKLVTLVEEMIEANEQEDTFQIPENMEVTLNDVADVLQALTNRLENIELKLDQLSKEEKNEEAEDKKEEPAQEPAKEEPAKEPEAKAEEIVADEKVAAMEKMKALTKKEKVNVILSDLF